MLETGQIMFMHSRFILVTSPVVLCLVVAPTQQQTKHTVHIWYYSLSNAYIARQSEVLAHIPVFVHLFGLHDVALSFVSHVITYLREERVRGRIKNSIC